MLKQQQLTPVMWALENRGGSTPRVTQHRLLAHAELSTPNAHKLQLCSFHLYGSSWGRDLLGLCTLFH